MKREDKKPILIFINPKLKEMVRYQAYKEHRSQNSLIEDILFYHLESKLAKDNHFKDFANCK